MKRRTKILLAATGVLVTGFAIYLLFASFVNFSDGYRAGSIVKMSHRGVMFKTYEGQLNTGALAASEGTTWNFSVAPGNKEVLADINAAVDGGYRVKLYYKEKYIRLPWKGDTKYFVYKVEKVGDPRVDTPTNRQ